MKIKNEFEESRDNESDPLYDTSEAAEYLDLADNTLTVWRCTGRYDLQYIKVGRLVRYRRSALDAFLDRRTRGHAGGDMNNEIPMRESKGFSFVFRRDLLPNPAKYYREQGLKLVGGAEWKNAICPFHNDNKPSLRIHLENGAFRCMACRAHGGDVLAFHMQRYGLPFQKAAKELGAWNG